MQNMYRIKYTNNSFFLPRVLTTDIYRTFHIYISAFAKPTEEKINCRTKPYQSNSNRPEHKIYNNSNNHLVTSHLLQRLLLVRQAVCFLLLLNYPLCAWNGRGYHPLSVLGNYIATTSHIRQDQLQLLHTRWTSVGVWALRCECRGLERGRGG